MLPYVPVPTCARYRKDTKLPKTLEKGKDGMQVTKKTIIKGGAEIARAAGCSHQHISYILRGMRKPGAKLAVKLRELGVKLPRCERNFV